MLSNATIIPAGDGRRVETPNAVMVTLASPTLGGASHAMWRVTMRPGQAGPPHRCDQEQIWTVLEGGARVEVGGADREVVAGDTLVLPPEEPRRVVADPALGLDAIVVTGPRARVTEPDGTDRGTPPWMT